MKLFNRTSLSSRSSFSLSYIHLSYINSSQANRAGRLTRVDVSKTTLVRYLDGLSYPSFYPICRVLHKLGSVQKTRILRVCRYKQSQSQSLTALLNHVNQISLVPFLALLWGESGWNDKHGRIKHAIKSGCKTVYGLKS